MLYWFARRMKEMKEVRGDERGFTLIELLIVIIIIGILAAIALPTFLAQREKAQIATCQSDTRNAAEAAVLYAADQPTGDFAGLDDVTADLVPQGFNQTEGFTTTIAGDAQSVTITTECPTGGALGEAIWTTDAGEDFRGEVEFVPAGGGTGP